MKIVSSLKVKGQMSLLLPLEDYLECQIQQSQQNKREEFY